MPHAIFVETDVDGSGLIGAYAAELPGCASFAGTDDEAVGAIPARVAQFTTWLRAIGEQAPNVVGDNWYEVERAGANASDGDRRRAAFTLDELPPSDDEFASWLRWLELAREELAEALDQAADPGSGPAASVLTAIERQDVAFIRELGGAAPDIQDDPIDRLYVARDGLMDALGAAGPTGEGVRRILRVAIADDLRATDALRGAGD